MTAREKDVIVARMLRELASILGKTGVSAREDGDIYCSLADTLDDWLRAMDTRADKLDPIPPFVPTPD